MIDSVTIQILQTKQGGQAVDVARASVGITDGGERTELPRGAGGVGNDQDTCYGLAALAQRQRLKLTLVGGDIASFFLGAAIAVAMANYDAWHGPMRTLGWLAVAMVTGAWAIRSQDLHLARVSSIRLVELTRLCRAVTLQTVAMVVSDRILRFDMRLRDIVVSATVTLLLLILWRSIYRASLTNARARGRHLRPIVVIGTDHEAARLVELISIHPELGLDLKGVIGSRYNSMPRSLSGRWLGSIEDTAALVRAHGATGAILVPNRLDPDRLNELVRELQAEGIHLFMSTTLAGIDARRMRSVALAHEPLLYIEPPALNRLQRVLKGIFDLTIASILVVALSPLFVAIAAAIKLGDRGPVLFRQDRVGRDGRTFKVYKFRTMVIDAEARLADLKRENERNGPLFKMTRDPRVTRIGHVLRETSLDELPQLLNVLRRQMSLVGPRPALPSEVATFPDELRSRERVLPGITGLWQAEARDNPSFEAYRRLDLFYVENWSMTLDLLIVVGTLEQIGLKLVHALSRRTRDDAKVLIHPTVASAGNAGTARDITTAHP